MGEVVISGNLEVMSDRKKVTCNSLNSLHFSDKLQNY